MNETTLILTKPDEEIVQLAQLAQKKFQRVEVSFEQGQAVGIFLAVWEAEKNFNYIKPGVSKMGPYEFKNI